MPLTSENERTDHPEFVFIGEHPAVDFANTLVVSNGQLMDLLTSWPDLVDWLSQAELSTAPGLNVPASRGAAALKSVLELRKAWREALAKIVDGGKVSDDFLERLNVHLAGDVFHETLHRNGRQEYRLVRSASRLQGEKLALAIVARQIALFLAGANLSYFHRCANTASCVLYFYDTTKNHRRQWCSVATCGNRHKVAAFRERQIKAGK
jgi:predicted RNA-binding Zn ribbon-like protein